MRYQSTTGLAAGQIEELAARLWQIAGGNKKQKWPLTVGLYRAIMLTLVYVRQNPNQATVGDLFGVSQPTVSRVYRRMLPLIGQALCLHIPDLKEAIRGQLVLIDGTDVPTGNRAGHEVNYSGKRRRSGLNIQIAANTDGGLLGVSAPLPGSMHDRKAFAECGWEDLLTETPTIARPRIQRNPRNHSTQEAEEW